MSINFGSSNTTRYYKCPDHADFTLAGDFTWLMVIAPDLTDKLYHKYYLSTGTFEAVNSINLYVTQTVSTLACAFNGSPIQTTPSMADKEFALCYGKRAANNVVCGEINLTTLTHNQAPAVSRSGNSDGGDIYIASRNDLHGQRFGKGYISWVALLNVAISDSDLAALASGTKTLAQNFGSDIVELWDMSVNSATITGIYKGHVLTRNGTGYGADGPDPLPYSSGPAAISFVGTVSDQSGTAGTIFNFDLKPFFTGTQTPFTYSVQAGTLPDGLSLTNGVITGNPTTAETKSGIVIRGTDSGSATADSNAFSITISAASAVVKGIKIILNTRATLLPVGAMSGITARYWDSPTAAGAPLVKTDAATIDANGEIIIDVDSVTTLPIGGTGYLSLYKQGAAPENDLHFAGRVPVSDIS